jgi:orotate phosphoribosyltransferase
MSVKDSISEASELLYSGLQSMYYMDKNPDPTDLKTAGV